MLSVLGGALFKLWRGIIIVLFCASFGSLCCYTISWYVCHPIVEKYLKKRIQQLSVKVMFALCVQLVSSNCFPLLWSK